LILDAGALIAVERGDRDTARSSRRRRPSRPPPDAKIKTPFTVAVGLTVCVAFTLFAGVTSPVLDFARHATTLF
jgi:hypothetical protein